MKTKIGKWLKYLAASIFLLALAVNVKVTLDDPFVMMSEAVIAQTTSSSTTGTTASTTTTTSTTTSGGGDKVLCEATVDCDSVGGDGSVKCYGYNSMYTCKSYPLVGKVECDGVTHRCVLVP